MSDINIRNSIGLLIFFLLLFHSLPLFAEITINIEYPGVDIEDIAEFEDLVDQFFDDYIGDIEENVRKEEMMKAFSEANAFNITVITHPSVYTFRTLSFSLNLSVSSQLFTINYDEFNDTMAALAYEDDIYLGFGFHPFTCSLLLFPEHIFPWITRYLTGLIMGIHIGGSRLHYFNYPLNSFNFGISALYPFFSKQQLGKAILWEPLTIHTSASFFYNSIIIPLEFDLSIPLTIDPDGDGPLEEITGTALVPMSPEISLRSETFVLPLALYTSLNIGWFLLLDIGCGLDIFLGRGYIDVDDEADIFLEGDLAGYLESTGKLTIGGRLYENHPDFVRFKISASLGFDFDSVWIKIPFVYYFNGGLSAGVKIGLSY